MFYLDQQIAGFFYQFCIDAGFGLGASAGVAVLLSMVGLLLTLAMGGGKR